MDLTNYFNNHGVIQYIYTNPQDIQNWLDTTPSVETFEFLMYAFPIAEQRKLFQIRDVANWYGELCEKISNNLDIEVISLGNSLPERRKKIKEYLGLFIKELVTMNLFDENMQSLITNFMDRSCFALQILLILLVADNTLTESTLLKLQVELNTQKRWESIGLLQLPTITEIENALNNINNPN